MSGSVAIALLVALGGGHARIGERGVARTVAKTVTSGFAAALAGVAF